ncbi:MAG: hypothetical protein MR598_05240 [Erysipelotrichaceae bacterium]|nr:hypothetical protein [Erysipelotrichaceae bacterium]
MSIFDDLLGNWIQIIDEQNEITIENYGYETGVIEGTTQNHCVKYVAVNNCWFKNEKGKKPEKFSYTGVNIVDTIAKGLFPGLYHYRCHCKEIPIEVVNIDNIKLIVPNGKIDWLFQDKSEWIKSMGYEPNDKFLKILYDKIKQAYFYGYYEIQNHTNFGVRIKLKVSIEGKGIKIGKTYNLKSSFMVFPNGKIKCNTLIGGWYK